MQNPVFTGVCPALVTPFGPDGAVNYDKFAQLVERQIAGGVSAVCVCGTTGESATLTTEEHLALVARCVGQVDGRVKVIAGSGSNNTAHALALSQGVKDAGADALLMVTPYYNKASQSGLIQHFTYIADRVAMPMILYNVPARTGVSMTAQTYAALAQHPNIDGVKEASGNLALVTHTRDLCPDDFCIWSGNDDQVVPLMALGAKGVISVASNLMPRAMAELVGFCQDGQFSQAARLQARYANLMDALCLEVNPMPVKSAMNLMGLDVGGMRLPLCALSDASHSALQDILRAYGLIA